MGTRIAQGRQSALARGKRILITELRMTPPAGATARASGKSTTLAAHLNHSLDERWRKYRKTFERCQRNCSEGSVHQLRVESRRLLGLVELLEAWVDGKETETLRGVLKDLFDRFAPLRDTHVQLIFVQKRQKRFPGTARFCTALARRENRLVRKLRKYLGHARQKRTRRLLASLRSRLASALDHGKLKSHGRALVHRRVDAAYARVARLSRQIDPARPETIHRTRIAFKKFRYLVELLQPLLPGVDQRQLKAMHGYQSLMGDIQDFEVLQAALAKFAKKKPAAASELTAFQLELERRHTALVSRYLRQAHKLDAFWPAPGISRLDSRRTRAFPAGPRPAGRNRR